MIDIKLLRENPEKVKKACENKQVKIDIDKVLESDKKRREIIQKIETLKSEQNKAGKEKIEEAKNLKEKIKTLEPELEKAEKEFSDLFLQIPNIPLDDVPIGKDTSENKMIKTWGHPSHKATDGKKDYLELAEKLDIIDVKRAAKVSGTRFGYLKGGAALLEFGLIKLALDTLLKEGFIPVVPPIMIKPEMMAGTGHLTERDKDEKYFIEKDNVYLAGSAEQPLAAMHADEVFNEKELPKRYVGFSSCFRREAGSYGKDTKGIFRVHQFDKVEMFSFCEPEDSIKEHQFFLSIQEKLMQLLKIPYRVVHICTGDLAFPAANAYDVEAWLPSEGRYRETHTTFNDTDFQTRRLNIKYRSKAGTNFVHALNGTAFAIGRTLIAIIENYQKKDGSIEVPKALRKYTGIKCITTR